MSVAALGRRSPAQVAKEKEIKGFASSQRDHLVIGFVGTARRKIMKLRNVGNCRTRRRGTTRSSQRVKLMVVPLLPLIIVQIMVMFLLLLLDVLLMMPIGYLILLVHIMSALTELCLVLMNQCRMEVLFEWAIILLVKLLA
jgi:hypothetical protein